MALEILENLYFIERGYLNGNHFVYAGKNPILIDTAYIADLDETLVQIQQLGVDPSAIKLIVNTHTHCDHIGGNHAIQMKSGCDIALHKIGKQFMDRHDDWSPWWKYFHQQASFFEVSRGLEDADTIEIGPHLFQVIHTPGHAADGIVLYHADEKLLISSDTLWENDIAVIVERMEGSTAVYRMLQSLEILSALDVDVVYPGHGKPFSTFHEAITASRNKLERYLSDPREIGIDLLKKIIVYTVMMEKQVDSGTFFENLLERQWFKETIDHYFQGEYQQTYHEIINKFLNRGIIKASDGYLTTVVKP